jgi:hypothetical protein
MVAMIVLNASHSLLSAVFPSSPCDLYFPAQSICSSKSYRYQYLCEEKNGSMTGEK